MKVLRYILVFVLWFQFAKVANAQLNPQKIHFSFGVESGKFNDDFIQKIYPSFQTIKLGVGAVKKRGESWLYYEFGSVDGQAIKMGDMLLDTNSEMDIKVIGVGYNWKFTKLLYLSIEGNYSVFEESGLGSVYKEKAWGLGIGGGIQFNLGTFAAMSIGLRYGYSPISSASKESYEGNSSTDMGRFTIGGAIKF